MMRCPDCHKLIGRFTVDSPPRCPQTGRLVDLATPPRHSSELARRPVNSAQPNDGEAIDADDEKPARVMIPTLPRALGVEAGTQEVHPCGFRRTNPDRRVFGPMRRPRSTS